jgi:hypothetical protein
VHLYFQPLHRKGSLGDAQDVRREDQDMEKERKAMKEAGQQAGQKRPARPQREKGERERERERGRGREREREGEKDGCTITHCAIS